MRTCSKDHALTSGSPCKAANLILTTLCFPSTLSLKYVYASFSTVPLTDSWFATSGASGKRSVCDNILSSSSATPSSESGPKWGRRRGEGGGGGQHAKAQLEDGAEVSNIPISTPSGFFHTPVRMNSFIASCSFFFS